MMDIKRFHVGKTLSEMAIYNETIYLAGQIAEDMTQDIQGQTREILGHIDRLLAEAGSDKTRILMCFNLSNPGVIHERNHNDLPRTQKTTCRPQKQREG